MPDRAKFPVPMKPLARPAVSPKAMPLLRGGAAREAAGQGSSGGGSVGPAAAGARQGRAVAGGGCCFGGNAAEGQRARPACPKLRSRHSRGMAGATHSQAGNSQANMPGREAQIEPCYTRRPATRGARRPCRATESPLGVRGPAHPSRYQASVPTAQSTRFFMRMLPVFFTRMWPAHSWRRGRGGARARVVGRVWRWHEGAELLRTRQAPVAGTARAQAVSEPPPLKPSAPLRPPPAAANQPPPHHGEAGLHQEHQEPAEEDEGSVQAARLLRDRGGQRRGPDAAAGAAGGAAARLAGQPAQDGVGRRGRRGDVDGRAHARRGVGPDDPGHRREACRRAREGRRHRCGGAVRACGLGHRGCAPSSGGGAVWARRLRVNWSVAKFPSL
jgi:hypothetical protein